MVEIADADVEACAESSYLISDRADDLGEARIAAAVRGENERRSGAGQAWIPHSTLPVPVQRPLRPVPRRVHGAQPIEP